MQVKLVLEEDLNKVYVVVLTIVAILMSFLMLNCIGLIKTLDLYITISKKRLVVVGLITNI